MKNKAKILAAILAAASVSMSLAGCSGDDTTSSDAASTGNETSTESTAEESTAEESSAAASGETVNLSWIQIGPQPNDLQMVTDAMNEYSKEKINVTCDYTYLDWSVYGDRMKAMIQGGEYFDIMFLNGGGSLYTSPIEMGRIAALDDYLAEVPDLEEFTPDALWEGVTYKGHIYAVPTYKDSACTNYWCWDKPTCDALGIPYEEIVTLEDLDPWLYTVKEGMENGTVDSALGQYPLYLTNGGFTAFYGVESYDLNNNNVFLGASLNGDGKVVRVLEQPEIMENLKLVHKWYNDGIINPDAPTATTQPTVKLLNFAQAFPGAEVSYTQSAGREVVISPHSGPDYMTWTVQGSLNAISSSSEHIVESLKYLELCNLDSTMRNMLAYGVEGTHWTDNGDGTITRDEVKMADYNPATYAQATFFTMAPVAPNTADQWTMVQDWVAEAEESPYLGFMFDTAPIETQLTACTALQAQYWPNIVTGAVDPETAVPEYYAAMDAAGLQDIQDELQRQLDEFMASKTAE